MRRGGLEIAKRVTFEAGDDGLYQSVDRGGWQRVARNSRAMTLIYADGELVLHPDELISTVRRTELLRPRDGDPQEPGQEFSASAEEEGARIRQALEVLHDRLSSRDGIFDLSAIRANRHLPSELAGLEQAKGYLVRVPGIGRLFAVRPEALRDWISGSVPIGRIVAELELRGWLIRGANGKVTRQVVIPTLGRHRLYCLKLAVAGNVGPTGVRRQSATPLPSHIDRDPFQAAPTRPKPVPRW